MTRTVQSIDAQEPTGKADLPLSQAQLERLSMWQSGHRCQDQPSYAWVFREPVEEPTVRTAWTRLVARYENLRTVFLDLDGRLHRGQRSIALAAEEGFVATEPDRFFDRLKEPLQLLGGAVTRIVHARDGADTMIGVCFDHLVIDGTTVRMVLADLWTYLRGEEPLGPAPLAPDDFIRDEARAAQSSTVVERTLAHWQETADGLTYPPVLPGLTRDPDLPPRQETAYAELAFDSTGDGARSALTRSAEVLAALASAVARVGAAGSDGADRLTTMVQGARRFTRQDARIAGFLSNWLVAQVPLAPRPDAVRAAAGGALLQALHVSELHHAEIVRRLEPELYGARYLPSEHLPPYAIFNYMAELPEPRIARSVGTPLALPPIVGNNLHGGLRVYASERSDRSGVTMRMVADAAVFGTGFADTVAAEVLQGAAA